MEFYLSPAATGYFNIPIQHTVEIVKERMSRGFFPWLMQQFKRKYDIVAQFDLPVFFVCENDLGESLRIPDWHICVNDGYEPAGASTKSVALNLPEYIKIPDEAAFNYNHNGRLIEPQMLQVREEELPPAIMLEKKEGSFDWYGLYYGYQASYRCIFIRIEKIMLEEPLLANAYGVASVVLHELAHALMDTHDEPNLRFTLPVKKELGLSLYYYVEEAMANLIAYRAIRGREVARGIIDDIALFMEGQPFPYALGVRMGKAKRIQYSSLDFIIKSYVLKWYSAKQGESTGIGDCGKWYGMIYAGAHFTDLDLKEQYQTLFV